MDFKIKVPSERFGSEFFTQLKAIGASVETT